MDSVSIVAPVLAIAASAMFIPLLMRLARGRRALAKLQNEILALRAEAEWLRTEKASLHQEMDGTRDELRRLRAELSIAGSNMAAREIELDDIRTRARAAGMTKSLFVANMSHELRTPLNGILGLARNLLDSEISPQQRSEVELIQVAGEDLMRIINDVLDLSKLDAGKLTLEQVPFDLRELLEGAFSLLYPQAERKGLAYGLSYSHKITKNFIGDPFRLRQVILNLLSNAIKFTESGAVILHASEGEPAAGALWIRIEVEDTGIGISPEQLRLIFEEFQQADLSTTRKYGGTGLGLSLSKRLAGLMGGVIEAESTSEEGSRFIVQIPLIPVRTVEAAAAERLDAQALDGLRLLVHERRANQICVLLRMLDALPGVIVERFSTADEAAERILNPPAPDAAIDAIFSSEGSSSVNARTVQSILRRCASRPPLHIIIGEGAAGHAQRQAEMASAEVLHAPLLPSALLACLRHIRRIPVGPLFEAAGITAHDVYRDSRTELSEPAPVLVAHENPIELRLLEAMLQKLGLAFVSARTEEELRSLLEGGAWKALVIQGRFLEDGLGDVLPDEKKSLGANLRLAVIGETNGGVIQRLSKHYAAFAHFHTAPRVSQLREFLNTETD